MPDEGIIEAGGVQWMTAGKGIIHSEMPEQEEGLLQGFQLWINLPAKEKMQVPAYQEFSADEVAVERLDNGAEYDHFVSPVYLYISLSKEQVFEQTVKTDDSAFIFVINGELEVGYLEKKINNRQMGILKGGDNIRVTAKKLTRFLLVAAHPLNEPVVRGGPFVMNTKAEVLQAFDDLKNNKL